MRKALLMATAVAALLQADNSDERPTKPAVIDKKAAKWDSNQRGPTYNPIAKSEVQHPEDGRTKSDSLKPERRVDKGEWWEQRNTLNGPFNINSHPITAPFKDPSAKAQPGGDHGGNSKSGETKGGGAAPPPGPAPKPHQ